MAKQKSSEVESKIDTITNILNIALIVLGAVLISLGIYYMLNNEYVYLMRIGTIIVVAGIVSIIIGLIGFFWHAKVARRMIKEAKENLNY